MERNLRFWGHLCAEVTALLLLAVFVLNGISFLFGYRYESFGSFMSQLHIMFLTPAAIIIYSINIGVQASYIPLLLSFGETRKNAFIGYISAKLAILTITMIVCGVSALLSGKPMALSDLLPESLILLIVSAFGGIIGSLFVRFKRIGAVIFILSCGSAGGIAGFTFSMQGDADLGNSLQDIMHAVPWWLYVTAGVLVCADILFHWAMLRRREVRL